MIQSKQSPSAAGITPRISVAMATYNGESFIREQLDSIARQTLLPIEIVITDDGSTDNTLQIVNDFSRTAPFSVRAYRNKFRLGYADNFLKAASLCNGDVIAFSDQDDIWIDNKLDICSQLFSDPSIVLVLHSARTFNQQSGMERTYPNISHTRILEWGKSDPFENQPGFAMLFRKKLLQLVDNSTRPWRASTHDQWTWFLASTTGRIALVADKLALYRQHETNLLGVPQHSGAKWNPARSATAEDYSSMAESELEGSNILRAAAGHWPALAKHLARSAEKLHYRSRIHRLRSRIYARPANILQRTRAFGQIALLGGYLPDRSKAHLGIRSAIKDLVLGVPGRNLLQPNEAKSTVLR